MNNLKHIKYFCIFFFAFFQVLSAQIGLPSANDIEEKRKNANLNRTKNLDAPAMPVEVPDSLEVDDLPFPFTNGNDKSLSLPSKIGLKYEYEAETDAYYLANQFGHESMKYALLLNKEEYETYILNQSIKEYYYNKSSLEDKEFQKEEKDKNAFGIKINSKFFKKIFGSDKIIIKPTGFASLDMGMVYQYLDNPQIPKERRGTLNMDLKQTMQFGFNAEIGEFLKFGANFDTNATFGFENQLLSSFKPGEDHILKSVTFGNIAYTPNNSLLRASQSLMGISSELQFGKTYVSLLFSEQKSESREIQAQSGSVLSDFEVFALDYDENRHYFLSQFFRKNYDNWLEQYPFIASGINITRAEVWVVNREFNYRDTRNIVGFSDLGEANQEDIVNTGVVGIGGIGNPQNTSNNLYNSVSGNENVRNIFTVSSSLQSQGYKEGIDYNKLENARKLDPSEYTLNTQLGFVTLRQQLLQDEVLAVSFEYIYKGNTYKVGEFSIDNNSVIENDQETVKEGLIAKLLKPSQVEVTDPIWKLMMKNVYQIGTGGISSQDFYMQLLYQNDETGSFVGTLPDQVNDKILLQLFNWDRLSLGSTPGSDGLFDFEEGITVRASDGLLFFTKSEPFSEKTLQDLGVNNPENYSYDKLYTSTKYEALQFSSRNKFLMKGKFTSQNSNSTNSNSTFPQRGQVTNGGISLGAINVPRGSVTVSHDGRQLIEGVDYLVDYQAGVVSILNASIANSNTPVNISLEDNAYFDIRTKRMMVVDVQHRFSPEFQIGATWMNYNDKPFNLKSSYNAESVNNNMYAFNLNLTKKAPFLTKLANSLPFYETEAPSNINLNVEAAYLSAGVNRQTLQNGVPTTYIDDFETSQNNISLSFMSDWKLASVPNDGGIEYNGNKDDLSYGYNRGLLSWYQLDPGFFNRTIGNVDADDMSEHAIRLVSRREIYPEIQLNQADFDLLQTLDLTYYPDERGPYNYDQSSFDSSGKLINPKENWGGIMRGLTTTNFEQANIEFIEFWVMDPYLSSDNLADNTDGEMVFHLGNISEDILKDGRKLYENGLPAQGTDESAVSTLWGNVPQNQSSVYAFSTEGTSQAVQDIGYDGLSDENEKLKNDIPQIFKNLPDPSADNYLYYLSAENANKTVLERYKYFNGTEGNSSASDNSATIMPDVEDVNLDQTQNTAESYFEYKFYLNRDSLQLGRNNIVDIRDSQIQLENGTQGQSKWYKVRIPVFGGKSVNGFNSYRSIRFMRMILKNLENRTTIRIGTLDMVRSEWRRYARSLELNNSGQEVDNDSPIDYESIGNFETNTIGINQQANRQPIPYVLPPGIERLRDFSNYDYLERDELSLSMTLRDLEKNDARAILKNDNLDLRRFKNLRMYVHAESLQDTAPIADDELSIFVRLGTDVENNYYEYEVPLKVTEFGAFSVDEIWPADNELNIPTTSLTEAKVIRNQSGEVFSNRYEVILENQPGKIFIKGSPSLHAVRTIMVGVRNNSNNRSNAEVWINELRMTEIEQSNGYAVRANLSGNMADFMNFQVSGERTSVGFGAIDMQTSERSLSDITRYNISTSFGAEKLLPKSLGLSLPVNYSLSEEFEDPKYNPASPDVLIADESQIQKDNSRSYNRAVNFSIAISKNKTSESEPRFYDLSNFNIDYSFSGNYRRDFITRYELRKNVNLNAGYQYNFKSEPIYPFKNAKMFQTDTTFVGKHLDILKEFHLNIVPKRVSLGTNIVRDYSEYSFRDLTNSGVEFAAFGKLFNLNYQYNVGWDLTKNLQLDFSSSTNRIVEDIGEYVDDPEAYNNRRYLADESLIFQDLFNVGSPMMYHHTLRANYRMPLEYFGLDFITANANYSADYDWNFRSRVFANLEENLGGILQNTNNFQSNANLDFPTLFGKVGYYKTYLEKLKIRRSKQKNKPKFIELPAKKEGEKPRKIPARFSVKDYLLSPIFGFQNLQINYGQNNNTVLPGVQGEPNFIGNIVTNGTRTPLGFMFGEQSSLRELVLLTTNSDLLNDPFQFIHGDMFGYSVQYSPFLDMNIQIDANRMYSLNSQTYGFNLDKTQPYRQSLETGNFTTTFWSFGSTFTDSETLYQDLRTTALEVATDLAVQNGTTLETDEQGFPKGYGLANQSVLTPALLKVYGGKKSTSDTKAFSNIPLPNWRVNYTGLMNFGFMQNLFKNFTVEHGYQSLYTIAGFTSNTDFYNSPTGVDLNGNFLNRLNYNAINISEQFSPLIGINFTTKNDMQLNLQYTTDRNYTLTFGNASLSEVTGKELRIGLGYRIKDVKMNMRLRGKKKTVKSDLNIRGDISLRDNQTTLRRLIEDNQDVTSGENMLSVKLSADYNFSKRLNVRIFYDQISTKYKVTTAFPINNIRFGLSARFNFSN